MKRLINLLTTLLLVFSISLTSLPEAEAAYLASAPAVSASQMAQSESAQSRIELKEAKKKKKKKKKKSTKKKKSSQSTTVYVTPTGKCYHRRKCGNGTYTKSTLSKAKGRGLRACKKCY